MLATHPIDEMILATDLGKTREPRTIEPEDTMPAEHDDLQDSASEPSDRTTIVVDASRGSVRGIATAVADAGAPVMAGSLGLRERRRLERDLHDGAQQRLVSLALTLRLAREKLDAEPDETARLLDRAREELDQALSELRDLARGIHPPVLADRGLGAAVEALAARAPLPVTVINRLPDRRLPERVELAAYFVVSEALTNVAKHASALNASVALTERDGLLEITVKDDGVGGADLDAAPACAASPTASQRSTAGSRSTPNRATARSCAPASHVQSPPEAEASARPFPRPRAMPCRRRCARTDDVCRPDATWSDRRAAAPGGAPAPS
jgi:Histidine kinase